MTALALLVTTLTLINPFIPGGASTTASRDPESIPLECDVRSALIVPVSLTGAPRQRFILDTGASLSMIDRDLAERLRLTPSGRIPSRSGSEALVTARLTIGSVTLPPQPIVAADLTRLRELMGNVSGILGADAVRALGAMTIDVDRCALRIGGRRALERDRVTLASHEGRPVVVSRDGGRLVLDSGASTLTLFEGRGASTLRSGPTTLVRIDRVDGASVGRVGRVSALALGQLDLAGTPAVVVKSWYDATESDAPDGLLPLCLFSQVHINLAEGFATFVVK